MNLQQVVNLINSYVWSTPLVLLCLGTGIYFSIRTRFLQVRLIKDMVRQLFKGQASKSGISSFQGFAMALGGRVGTGNIAGVATAIAMGGPGALFWMWMIAFLGAGSSGPFAVALREAGAHTPVEAALLATLLDGDRRRRLEREAPSTLVTPAGTRRAIDYLAGTSPLLAVPLQEMLGTRDTPAIASGRVRLLMQLLSPAGRPIQLTQDLPGFWTGSYALVRKEMRGRYPKHHWPEDPANAAPMARSIKSRGV